MRAFGSLATILLSLAFVSGAPALTGCDSGEDTVQCPAGTFDTEDLTPEGTQLGATLRLNDCVSVRYVGRLADGSGTFDEGTLNFFFTTTSGLIPGFILGMAEQRVGEARRVTIPPSLGYGAREVDRDGDGMPEIPSCSTLEFDITLTAINQDTRVCSR